MKPTLTATRTTLAAAIALAGMTAAPAHALTDQERAFLLLTGVVTYALLSGGTPAPAPTPIPHTYSTGPINMLQSTTADFDHGRVGVPGSDLWFQATSPTHRYLRPINGARMAVGSRSNRGFAGCSHAAFSSHRVRLSRIPVGSYVCMKTGAGRISQFRMNNITGGAVKTIHIGYTTWQ